MQSTSSCATICKLSIFMFKANWSINHQLLLNLERWSCNGASNGSKEATWECESDRVYPMEQAATSVFRHNVALWTYCGWLTVAIEIKTRRLAWSSLSTTSLKYAPPSLQITSKTSDSYARLSETPIHNYPQSSKDFSSCLSLFLSLELIQTLNREWQVRQSSSWIAVTNFSSWLNITK